MILKINYNNYILEIDYEQGKLANFNGNPDSWDPPEGRSVEVLNVYDESDNKVNLLEREWEILNNDKILYDIVKKYFNEMELYYGYL